MLNPQLGKVVQTLAEKDFPKIFAVELCADCNLNCSMCHHDQMRRPKGKLPVELFQRVANQIAVEAPDTDVWFSFCGEPLLDPERLFQMLDYGGKVGLRSLNLNTNGVYLTQDVARKIIDSPLRVVVVGIDGFSAPVYESIRVGAKRDEVYANVEYLLKLVQTEGRGPEVMVQFIEMDENLHEVEDYKKYWGEKGATLKIRNKLSWGGKFDTPLMIPRDERIPCPWAMTMMHLFWDGRVPRCPGDTEGEEGSGNAWDDSVKVLWGRLGDYRQKHMERRFDELPQRCQECKDWMTGGALKIRPTQNRQQAPVATPEPTHG